MSLDAKISAAIRCIEREYPQGIDQHTLDHVIAEVTRDHHEQVRLQFVEATAAFIGRLRRIAGWIAGGMRSGSSAIASRGH